jgi:ATP-dependent Clp protease ATP-binding subunit ClpC
MFDRFTEDAKRMMSEARKAAQDLRQPHIDTEHMLLGLLALPESGGCRLLSGLGIEPAQAREAVRSRVKRGEPTAAASDMIPFTDAGKRVLMHAMESAAKAGHNWIGTEHLLLGLIRDIKTLAARALVDLGATVEKLEPGVAASESPSDFGPSTARPTGRFVSAPPLDVRAGEILSSMLDDEHSVLVRALRMLPGATPGTLREAIREVLSSRRPPE